MKINENKDYKFFVLLPDNTIFSGWEYKEDAKDSLEDVPSGDGKVVTLAQLKKLGIDPKSLGESKMSKFNVIYEEIMSEFVKPTKDITDEEIADVAKKAGVKDIDIFITFVKEKFKGGNLSKSYIQEWAERFVKKTAWIYADKAARKVLDKVGYVLSDEESHLKKDQEN